MNDQPRTSNECPASTPSISSSSSPTSHASAIRRRTNHVVLDPAWDAALENTYDIPVVSLIVGHILDVLESAERSCFHINQETRHINITQADDDTRKHIKQFMTQIVEDDLKALINLHPRSNQPPMHIALDQSEASMRIRLQLDTCMALAVRTLQLKFVQCCPLCFRKCSGNKLAESHICSKSLLFDMGAEPGRYMATRYSTLFTHVQGKREEPADPSDPISSRKFLYYINDGVYGSLNCIMLDHAHPETVPAYRFMKDRLSLDRRGKTTYQPTSSNGSDISLGHAELPYMSARGMHSSSKRDQNCAATVFDATCNSMDIIVKDFPMQEWLVGDWLAFASMGVGGTNDSIYFNQLLSNDLCTSAETVLIATDHGPVVTSTLDAISCARAGKGLIGPLARKRTTDDDNVKLVSTPVYGPFHESYQAKPSGADILPVDPSLDVGRDIDHSLKNRVALVVPPNLVTMSLLGVSLTRATVVNDAGLDPPVASSPHPSHALYPPDHAAEFRDKQETNLDSRAHDTSTSLCITRAVVDRSSRVTQAVEKRRSYDQEKYRDHVAPRSGHHKESDSVVELVDIIPCADGVHDAHINSSVIISGGLQVDLSGNFSDLIKSVMLLAVFVSYQDLVLIISLIEVNSTAAFYPGSNSGGVIVTAVPPLGHHCGHHCESPPH